MELRLAVKEASKTMDVIFFVSRRIGNLRAFVSVSGI
jgi:hypothetical protein